MPTICKHCKGCVPCTVAWWKFLNPGFLPPLVFPDFTKLCELYNFWFSFGCSVIKTNTPGWRCKFSLKFSHLKLSLLFYAKVLALIGCCDHCYFVTVTDHKWSFTKSCGHIFFKLFFFLFILHNGKEFFLLYISQSAHPCINPKAVGVSRVKVILVAFWPKDSDREHWTHMCTHITHTHSHHCWFMNVNIFFLYCLFFFFWYFYVNFSTDYFLK